MLGRDGADLARLRGLVNDAFTSRIVQRLEPSMRSLAGRLVDGALQCSRRETPREDLLAGLVQAEHEGSKPDHAEMLSMLVLLLVAGNETTTTLLGHAVLELLAHPEELAKLRRDPSPVPGAVEETLRSASPVQLDPRRATRPVELHGRTLEPEHPLPCTRAPSSGVRPGFPCASSPPDRASPPALSCGR